MLAGPVALLIALAGCANQVHVSGSREDGAARGKSYSRIIVLGISPSIDERCGFEFVLASKLRSDTVEAVRSCDVVAQKEPLTRESIAQAVTEQQADAVVATVLVAEDWSLQEGNDRDTRGGEYFKATGVGYMPVYGPGFWGMYGVPAVYGQFKSLSPITTAKGEIKVKTQLWETSGPSAVYTVETSAKNLESTDVALLKIATPIADRLKRSGLVR
jgi:hypothetical protein